MPQSQSWSFSGRQLGCKGEAPTVQLLISWDHERSSLSKRGQLRGHVMRARVIGRVWGRRPNDNAEEVAEQDDHASSVVKLEGQNEEKCVVKLRSLQ